MLPVGSASSRRLNRGYYRNPDLLFVRCQAAPPEDARSPPLVAASHSAGGGFAGTNVRQPVRHRAVKRACEANLSGTDLHSVAQIHADLTGADLTSSNLFSEVFTRATMINVDLSHANLSRADLTDAHLDQHIDANRPAY
ncbi:pentapeptide repeat-containing protein [Nocardia sp. NPDC058518]|uniref:pentapeptide repeat-containing protein n=1 Tax=Nocardia sp. NPDC058518 TaxID=3346534 RepID=UPI003657D556